MTAHGRASTMATPVLYTPAEAAGLLRVCRTTLYGLIRSGELQSITIGRRRLISADALTRYVESLETAGSSGFDFPLDQARAGPPLPTTRRIGTESVRSSPHQRGEA